MDLPKSIEAVQWVHDLLHKHRVMIPSGDGHRTPPGRDRRPLRRRPGGADRARHQPAAPLRQRGERPVRVGRLPHPAGKRRAGRPPVTYTSGDPNCVNAATNKKDAAWQLARWFAGPGGPAPDRKSKLAYPALIEAVGRRQGVRRAARRRTSRSSPTCSRGRCSGASSTTTTTRGIAVYRSWLDKAFDAEQHRRRAGPAGGHAGGQPAGGGGQDAPHLPRVARVRE